MTAMPEKIGPYEVTRGLARGGNVTLLNFASFAVCFGQSLFGDSEKELRVAALNHACLPNPPPGAWAPQ